MIVVFTNEDSLTDNNETLDGYLEESSGFKEILAACNNRVVLFDNRAKTGKRKKAKKVQRLLYLVEEVVSKNNKKPFLFDLSHKTMENEAEVEEKQKNIKAMMGHYTEEEKGKEEEKSNWKEEEENSPHHQFRQRVKKVEETTSWLEKKLNEVETARHEAETRARKQHEDSSEEIRMLREKLKEAEKKLEKQEGGCIVL